MSYVFPLSKSAEIEQKIQDLENDIKRFCKACKSEWARPVDYTNLIDARYVLKTLKDPIIS